LTLQAPSLILPVLVTILLSAETNAWFYVSWSITSIANIASSSLTTALYASSSAQPNTLPRKIRFTLGLALAATVLTSCVLLFATKQVLGIFGHSYAEQATWSLRILALESFPFIIKTHYIAVRRIEGKVAYATLPSLAGGTLELGASALGAHLGGLSGLSLGWLLAVCIEAGCMSGTVYRAARPGATNEGRKQCAS
jgi:O-antigen/teichoic acid export membrane protein